MSLEFNVVGDSSVNDYDKKIIYNFLSNIDASQLSYEVANSMSWGDGDPIFITIELLKRKLDI